VVSEERGKTLLDMNLSPNWTSEVQMAFAETISQDGLVAEYRLEQDIVPDEVGLHNGQIFGTLWRP
jgi:hypothetical protein